MKTTNLFLATVTLLASAALADDIAVTIYNSNLGVVSETRKLEFKKGAGQLAFRDVPAQIDASSVRFEALAPGKNVSILEQNYAFDLIGPEQMYAKYIDNEIELIDKDGKLYSGTLLAYSGGSATLKESSGRVKIVLMQNISEVNFPALPDGLITRPTLFWLYDSNTDGSIPCRVGYQTSGLNWNAEYVGVLDKAESKLDLSGWSSINNTSGKSYKNATLKLIAGDINRVSPRMGRGGMTMELAMDAAKAAPGFEEKAFFEYHMYTLPRKATIADKEIKQISLFDPAKTTVQKVYLYQPDQNATQVRVAVKFKNSQQQGLGMPLPEGRIRMFKADDDGALVLLGEDQIKHTPKDEEMDIKVGYAFDIAAEERVTNQSQVSNKVTDYDYENEIRNHKTEPVTVKIEKKFYGFWTVQQADFKYVKKDANTLVFELPVKAGETVTVRYRIRMSYR